MRKSPLLVAFWLLCATPAWPCGFHNYTPQPTMVEHMLGSRAIVLARQSDTSHFVFEVIARLAGDMPQVRIPFLVDSSTRRKFELDPDAAVLLTFDGESQTWKRIGFVGYTSRSVIYDIVEQLPAWRLGGDDARAEMFARLLDHPDASIRKLALRELDRVDYSILRGLRVWINTGPLLQGLADPAERNLVSIRALLLGLSRDPDVLARLERGVGGSQLGSGPEMGAFATAWVELGGQEAIVTLARQHLADPETTQAARELIVEAFALHSSYGSPITAEIVQRELAEAILRDPALAIPAARQFLARYDWALSETIAAVLDQLPAGTEEEQSIVTHYLLFSGSTLQEE